MEESHLSQLAVRLLQVSEKFNEVERTDVMPHLDADDAAHVIKLMMRNLESEDDITNVNLLMPKLEQLANSEPDLAISLMAALKPIAGRLCMHDVYDAIELWFDAETKRPS